MPESPEDIFNAARHETFGRIAALIDARIAAIPRSLLLSVTDISIDTSRDDAMRECWSLLKSGILHLQSGAPGGKAGSMSGALTKASLRASALAAALGIPKPEFEAILLPVDGYSTGQEAAVFLCRRLSEAAEADLTASKTLINKKIQEGANADPLDFTTTTKEREEMKRQVIFSFNMLTAAYSCVCGDLRDMLDGLTPPTQKPKQGPKP